MAAGVYPITMEENSDFTMIATWYDDDGEPVDITDYGALMVVKEERDIEADEICRVDHNVGITVGDTDGTFKIRVTEGLINPTDRWGWYEFITFPLTGDITFNPTRLLQGQVEFDFSSIDIDSYAELQE